MSDELSSWPAEGRVGLCTSGTAAGSHILLWRESHDDWWTFYLSTPECAHGQVDGYIEGAEAVEALLEDWGVVWAAIEEDRRLERELFDVRRTFRR